VSKFGADATRMGLAESGDSIEDANFVSDFVNKAILRLFTQIEWVKEILATPKESFRTGSFEASFNDNVFASQINQAIVLTNQAYSDMLYREGALLDNELCTVAKCFFFFLINFAAQKTGFFDLQAARDRYVAITSSTAEGLNYDLVLRFIEIQTLLLSPICPHVCEYIWTKLLNKGESVLKAKFPVPGPIDQLVLAGVEYFDNLVHDLRLKKQVCAALFLRLLIAFERTSSRRASPRRAKNP